jgi:transposase InsO family protein
MTLYGQHKLMVSARDSSGVDKTVRQSFWSGAFRRFDLVLGIDWLIDADVRLAFTPFAFIYGGKPRKGKGGWAVESQIDKVLQHVREGTQAYIAYCVGYAPQDPSTPAEPNLDSGGETEDAHPEPPRDSRDAPQTIAPLFQPALKKGTTQAKREATILKSHLQNLCKDDEDLLQFPEQYYRTLVAAIAEEELPPEYSQFEDVFDGRLAGVIPLNSEHDHAIELEEGKVPPHMPIYNLSQNELTVLREYIADALEKGWIRPSKSPAGAPILFVPKADGSLRLCVDYRGLNRITIKNRYPLPLISELLDRFSRAKVFSKLDLRDAYHRLRIREGDEWKTAFRTRYGHFEYLVMPFGLANAPATFQAYIHNALGDLLDTVCVVYLDDILIYSDSEEEHREHVRLVLNRLRRWKLYAKLSKCEFHTKRVDFLGFVVTPHGVVMDPKRVVAIQEWPEPESYRDIQVFLGFANFYRRFIYNYSEVARPLNDLLKGAQQYGAKSGKRRDVKVLKKEWAWPETASEAFRKLRDSFTTAPVLRHFDPASPCMVITDASDAAYAGILLQPHDGSKTQHKSQNHWHPVAYYSQSFHGSTRNYEVHDKELMAIVECFREWRHYLEGAQHAVRVVTDHNNLRYFMTTKALNGRQARWAERLAAFDFEIEYKKGSANPADGPSRRPDYFKGFKEETIVAARNLLLPTLQHKLQAKNSPPRGAGESMEDAEQLAMEHAITSRHLKSKGHSERDLVAALHSRSVSLDSSSGSRSGAAATRATPGGHVTETRDAATPATFSRTAVEQSMISRVETAAATKAETPMPWDGDMPEALASFVRQVQSRDPFAEARRNELTQGTALKGPTQYTVDEQDLLRRGKVVYIPRCEPLKLEILRRNHDDPTAGHYGYKRTQKVIARKYYWVDQNRDVADYVRTCDVCQRTKAKRHKPFGFLQPLPQPDGAWRHFSMDFVTDLPPIVRGGTVYDSILVIVDRFTKLARYIPTTKSLSAEGLANLITSTLVMKSGPPLSIVSDRGTVFTSEYWSTFCYLLNVTKRLSTAFHPQSDGQTERMNQELENHLRIYCSYAQDNWVDLLDTAEFAYNSKESDSIKMSPLECAYGQPAGPLDGVRDRPPPKGEGRHSQSAAGHVESLRKTRERALEHYELAQQTQKKYYDRKHIDMNFEVGEQVLLRGKNVKTKRPCRKLEDKYLGPFEILERKGLVAYKLQLPTSMKRIHDVFHVSLLEPYHRRQGAQPPAVPEIDEMDESNRFEVEQIVAHQTQGGQTIYRVRWLGYDQSQDTWEGEVNLDNCQELLLQYKEKHVASGTAPKRATRTPAAANSNFTSQGEREPRKRGRPKGSRNRQRA